MIATPRPVGARNDMEGYYPVLQAHMVSPAILTRSEVLLALSVGKLTYKDQDIEGASYGLDVSMFTVEECSWDLYHLEAISTQLTESHTCLALTNLSK